MIDSQLLPQFVLEGVTELVSSITDDIFHHPELVDPAGEDGLCRGGRFLIWDRHQLDELGKGVRDDQDELLAVG